MPEPENTGRSISPKAVTAGVLVVLVLIFVFQNTESKRVDAYFWSFTMPAWIWLLVVFLVGVAVGSVFPWFRPRRKRDD